MGVEVCGVQVQRLGVYFRNLNQPLPYIVIDLRGKQSFEVGHIRDSISLQTYQQVLGFLSKQTLLYPLLFVCFSKKKSMDMAKRLSLILNTDIYPHSKIYYLDGGILEVSDPESGIPLVEGNCAPTVSDQCSALVLQTIQEIKQRYLKSRRTFVVAFSGGKDSTVVLQLVYDMLCSLPQEQRRPTFAVVANTLVEPPHIDAFLHNVIKSINTHAKENGIPFKVLEATPDKQDQFWFNLIGKGYPSPTRSFRWCTDRLKITPSKKIVGDIVKKYGSVLLCLGVRKSESTSRKKSIEKRTLGEEGYSQHNDFPNTLIYSPIVDWTTDDVWAFLLSNRPKWKKDHSELFELYSQASGDECQFITDLKQSSCGGSRFGCWVCTLVNEDKSMQGFIASGHTKLKPLNEFRNFIQMLRWDSKERADYMRDGRAVYKNGRMGPFLSSARIKIFRRLLESEYEFKQAGGTELISDSQIKEIQRQWNIDFDLCNTAIEIAKEFGRMKDEENRDSFQILHSEILENIANREENRVLGLGEEELGGLIRSAIKLIRTYRSNIIDRKIREEIEKLIKDKTSKQIF